MHPQFNDKPHMRPSPCKRGTEVVLTNTFWRTLFRIINSSDKRLWPSGVKGNIFLLMQSLYYQRHAVIHYLTNASLQSWFKNRLELLIHSFFYECIKCQTSQIKQSNLLSTRENKQKQNSVSIMPNGGPDGGAHSQWRRKSSRCRLSILDHVKGLAIILQPKGDHPICPQINKLLAATITMHLMMLLFLWNALVKLII